MKVKDRILETAFKLFHTQGYNSTGINQIIAESVAAKASFYQHFKSKEELCIAFLNKRHQYWFDQLREFVLSEITPDKKIDASFQFIVEMNAKENFRGCSFLNILSEIPNNNTRILGVIQSHKNELRQYFKQILSNQLLADHVYLLFESAIIESQMFKNNWPIEQAKNIMKTLIK